MERIEAMKKTPSWVAVGVPLVLFCILAAFLSLHQIGRLSFWNDELFTVWHVNLGMRAMRANMSLYYLLVHVWMTLFSEASEGTLRTLSAIFFVFCIPAVFLLGRTVSNGKRAATATGLLAALLMAINAYAIQYAQELRSYSMVTLFAILSTFFLI